MIRARRGSQSPQPRPATRPTKRAPAVTTGTATSPDAASTATRGPPLGSPRSALVLRSAPSVAASPGDAGGSLNQALRTRPDVRLASPGWRSRHALLEVGPPSRPTPPEHRPQPRPTPKSIVTRHSRTRRSSPAGTIPCSRSQLCSARRCNPRRNSLRTAPPGSRHPPSTPAHRLTRAIPRTSSCRTRRTSRCRTPASASSARRRHARGARGSRRPTTSRTPIPKRASSRSRAAESRLRASSRSLSLEGTSRASALCAPTHAWREPRSVSQRSPTIVAFYNVSRPT